MKFSMPNVNGAISRVRSEVQSQLSSVSAEVSKFPSLASETHALLKAESETRKSEFTALGQAVLSGNGESGV